MRGKFRTSIIMFTLIVITVGILNVSCAETPQAVKIELVTKDNMKAIKKNPEKINQNFLSSEEKLRKSLGSDFKALERQDLYVIYASMVAYELAPYGNSNKIDFYDILKEPKLDCDNYAIALANLYKLNQDIKNSDLRIVGWHGGAIGNHAQLFYRDSANGIRLLIDPTVGIVAMTDFDSVASGKKVSVNTIIDFSSRDELQEYKTLVIEALTEGKYKPSDLLYYFEDLDHMTRHTIDDEEEWPPDWMTPGAIKLRSDINKEFNNK